MRIIKTGPCSFLFGYNKDSVPVSEDKRKKCELLEKLADDLTRALRGIGVSDCECYHMNRDFIREIQLYEQGFVDDFPNNPGAESLDRLSCSGIACDILRSETSLDQAKEFLFRALNSFGFPVIHSQSKNPYQPDIAVMDISQVFTKAQQWLLEHPQFGRKANRAELTGTIPASN